MLGMTFVACASYVTSAADRSSVAAAALFPPARCWSELAVVMCTAVKDTNTAIRSVAPIEATATTSLETDALLMLLLRKPDPEAGGDPAAAAAAGDVPVAEAASTKKADGTRPATAAAAAAVSAAVVAS